MREKEKSEKDAQEAFGEAFEEKEKEKEAQEDIMAGLYCVHHGEAVAWAARLYCVHWGETGCSLDGYKQARHQATQQAAAFPRARRCTGTS